MRLAHGTIHALCLVGLVTATGCGKSGSSKKGGETPPPANAGEDDAPVNGGGNKDQGSGPSTQPNGGTGSGTGSGTGAGTGDTGGTTGTGGTAGTGGTGGTGGTTSVSAECETAWKQKLKTYKPGVVTTYELTYKVEGGLVPVDKKRLVKEAVKEVTDDSVTKEITEQELSPHAGDPVTTTVTQTKNDHVAEECLGGDRDETAARLEVLADRDESLTVRAGTFDAHYHKEKQSGTVEGDPYEATSETWVKAGSAIELKTVNVIETTWDDRPRKQTTTKELVELVLP